MVVEIPVRRFLPEITVSLSVKTEKDQKEKSTRAMHGLLMLAIGSTGLMGMGQKKFNSPVVMGEESMMSEKGHGTYHQPVQQDLRWGCSHQIADNICNFNRHYAERAGYFERSTRFLKEEGKAGGKVEFYDSNTGFRLFRAPSIAHGRILSERAEFTAGPLSATLRSIGITCACYPMANASAKREPTRAQFARLERQPLLHQCESSYCIRQVLIMRDTQSHLQSFDSHAFLPPKARKRGWSSCKTKQ